MFQETCACRDCKVSTLCTVSPKELYNGWKISTILTWNMGESCYVIKSHLKMSFFLKFPVAVNNIYLALLCHCQKSVQLSSCLTRKRTSWHVMQKMSNNVEPRQTMSLLFVREVWQPVQSWFLILQMQQFLLKCSQP